MDGWKILSTALTIAVALLLYDRFLKPAANKMLPATAANTTNGSFDEQVEKLLAKERF